MIIKKENKKVMRSTIEENKQIDKQIINYYFLPRKSRLKAYERVKKDSTGRLTGFLDDNSDDLEYSSRNRGKE